jgi:hypothetical protein
LSDRTRVFAQWVRPVAAQLAADRARVLEFARAASTELWLQPSAVEGWTKKELLAHLAGGNDQMVQTVLRAVTSHTPLDAKTLDPDTDAENAARVAERRVWTIEELIAELVRGGDEMQELLSQLTDSDADVRLGSARWTLRQLLKVVERERHDHEHLSQIGGRER